MPDWVERIFEDQKRTRKEPLEVKKIGRNFYLYKSTTIWLKDEKKRRKVSKYIGKITKDGLVEGIKKMAPARSIYEYGNAKLLLELSKDILSPLKTSFPDETNEIIAMAFIRLIQQSPIRLMKTKWEKLYLSDELEAALSPNSLSEKLRIIGSNWSSQKEFFDTLLSGSKYLIYDLSSIFSYSENLALAEKGHNADHLFLKQINFALFFSPDKNLPVMLKPMPGSVRDIKSLKHALNEWNISSSVAILDRGFASKTMPELMKEKFIKFILPLKRNFKIIDYNLELKECFIYRNRGVNWTRMSVGDAYIYLYEDVKLRAEEETTFIEMIGDGNRTRKELDEEREKFGKIAILSNIDDNGETIYLLFKERGEIEIAFDAMKNELENDKTYLSNDDAVRGYFFVSFISLYLYFRILELLRRNELIGKMSVNEVLFELSKVYLVHYSDGKRMLSEVPKKCEKLEEMLGFELFPKSLRS